MASWQRAVNWLDALDRRWNNALRRTLGAVLIGLFLAGLCLMLYLWFRLMQPYPE
jgi:hypothetical protein